MDITDVKIRLLNLVNNIGIFINVEDVYPDIDLTEYIVDSLQFITLLVEIEEDFKVEVPEEMLLFDNLKSLNSFARSLAELCKEQSV